MNQKFWASLLYRVFLAKKKFPKRLQFWVMTWSLFLGKNFHFLQFLPYCFLYLLYSLICIFMLLCFFLMLKLGLLMSSYFDDVITCINLLSSLSRRVICWVISRFTRFIILIIVSHCSVNWKISFEFCNKKR